jgi:hypothetical protein
MVAFGVVELVSCPKLWNGCTSVFEFCLFSTVCFSGISISVAGFLYFCFFQEQEVYNFIRFSLFLMLCISGWRFFIYLEIDKGCRLFWKEVCHLDFFLDTALFVCGSFLVPLVIWTCAYGVKKIQQCRVSEQGFERLLNRDVGVFKDLISPPRVVTTDIVDIK